MRIRFKHAGILFSWLIRSLCRTLKIEINDQADILKSGPREPVIWAFWHNQMFMLPWIKEKWAGNVPAIILSSPSDDGQIVADICAQFGMEAARGSSSKPYKGMSALIMLATKLKAGFDVGITPDGPRGPCHRVNPGVLKLAQLTGRLIMPVHVQFENFWRLRTWDRFIVPKPFSRVLVTMATLIAIPRELDEEGFEQHRQGLEALMRAAAEPVKDQSLSA